MRATLLAIGFLILWPLTGLGIVQSQGFQFVHPPSTTAADFNAPEEMEFNWKGPFVQPFNAAKCWYAQPNAPDVAIGGSDEWQRIVGFIPIGDLEPAIEYHQRDLRTFAGGGASHNMKETDLPAGLFLSFKAHPVWKIVSVVYPARNPLAGFGGSFQGVGVLVTAEFLAGKTMGECFFVGAAWIASAK